MTRQEHADRIHRRMLRVEAAVKSLHAALAAAARDHGEDIGLDGEVQAASFAPKDD